MRFLLRCTANLAVMGGLYFSFASGGVHVTLPAAILGYRVPVEAQQFVDRTAKIAAYGQQSKDGFRQIASGLR
jgi:Na+/H+ antiporter NhaA